MFLAAINKPKQLLYFSFIHQVKAEELQQVRENVIMLLADLTSGFRLLTDLGRLDSMDLNCAAEIGKMMEMTRTRKSVHKQRERSDTIDIL